MNNISIGQYIPGDSIIHRADPRTKLFAVLVYMVMLFVSDGPWGLALAAVFVVTALVTARIGIKLVLRSARPVLLVAILTALINLFSVRTGDVLLSAGFITITSGGLATAVRMTSRLFLLIIGVSILTYTTTPISLTDGLEKVFGPLKKIHFPVHDIAMMMTIAIRFVPPLVEEADRITKAQASRGADFTSGGIITRVRRFFPILLPMIIGAFTRADQLADAMEARCYRGDVNRTKYRRLQFTSADAVLFPVIFAFAAGMILIRIFVYGGAA